MIANKKIRDIVLQIVVVGLFLGTIATLAVVSYSNVRAAGMSYGWSFLSRQAGVVLTSTWPFAANADATYLDIIVIGTVNTIRLALIVIVLSILLGVPVGAARLSRGPAAWLASVYVHIVRGPSLLLHVLFWYALTRSLDTPKSVYQEGDRFIFSNRGIFMPTLSAEAWKTALAVLALSLLVIAAVWWARRGRFRENPRSRFYFLVSSSALAIAAAIVATPLANWGNVLDLPAVRGFRIVGGIGMSPEFFAFFAAAVVYIANYVAEIVRQGVQSVDRGLSEAGIALALKPWQIFFFIQLPVAMRNMLPPLTNLMTFIVKSTAAATAVGFSELFTVTSLSINHTGHVIELLLIMVVIYVVLNNIITFVMGRINDRMKIVTR